jgi:hypothetical protein
MTGLSERWKSFEAKVFARADIPGAEAWGASGPCSLAWLGRKQRVKTFIFRELPIDGGIAVDGNGFIIHVNCREELAAQWQAALNDDGDGGKSLPVKARFTIAHEIAHTFLYQMKDDEPPRSLVSGKHPRELGSLERTCNRGAARLLVPERAIKAVVSGRSVVNAEALTKLSVRSGVSGETLVHRLRSSKAWSAAGTSAIFASEEAGILRIQAVALDGRVRLLIPKAVFGERLDSLFSVSCLTAFGGSRSEAPIDIPCVVGGRPGRHECHLTCSQLGSEPKRFIITVEPGRSRSDQRPPIATS